MCSISQFFRKVSNSSIGRRGRVYLLHETIKSVLDGGDGLKNRALVA